MLSYEKTGDLDSEIAFLFTGVVITNDCNGNEFLVTLWWPVVVQQQLAAIWYQGAGLELLQNTKS